MNFTRKIVFALLAAVCIAGCSTTAVISDLQTDKVIVQADGNNLSVIEAEARRGCAIHNRRPVPISHRCLDHFCTQMAYLYACT
jgi:hypothetical protein